MLDRNTKPATKEITIESLPGARIEMLNNGIPVYIIDMGEQEVCRIDLFFSAGTYDQEKALAACMTNIMLKEGTRNLSSKDIAEKLDFYGAWLQPSASTHNSYITLYSLNRYFNETVSILEEIIKYPTFPQDEFSTLLKRRQQQFLVEQEKVQTLAGNKLAELLFGKEHPYGKRDILNDYNSLMVDDLKKYHHSYYQPQYCKIIMTGRVSEEMIGNIDNLFGSWSLENSQSKSNEKIEISSSTEKEAFIFKENALQSSIKIGLPLPIDRSHKDFFGLKVLNTLFGGYFGSRLMSNIREEKGYTYGIGSSLVSLPQATYLGISTQTGIEYTQPLITEVFAEIEKLKTEPVSTTELITVKNYMLGELARLFDSPFSIADSYLSILANKLPINYYENQAKAIHDITSDHIMNLAKLYLKEELFYTVIAGKKE